MISTSLHRSSSPLHSALALAILVTASAGASARTVVELSLDGSSQIPPVATSATGKGHISLQDDLLLKGSIDVSGIDATRAHVHEAAFERNGPPIITLDKDDDNTFSVPQNTKLTRSQYRSFLAGNLYISVRSTEHPKGEIRAQLISKQ